MSNPGTYFPKGVSGNPEGKRKGTKNKIRYDVLKILDEHNFNPFIKLIELAENARSEHVKLEATTELAGYVAPKLKQISLPHDTDSPVHFTINLDGKSISADTHVRDENNGE